MINVSRFALNACEGAGVPTMKELPRASFYEMALVFTGARFKYICEGTSMNPTLYDGEVVLVDRNSEPQVGDIVVAKHPVEQTTEIVKRIQRINEHGHYFLVGDNAEDSNDSREFGAVRREYIKGKVVARL
ncbi:MAG TPA: nickel-type superoxide dismutase maturation protease [Pyrinomonadaceae bacterium]|nr:nickel-type superoxide dismutase maturation protease [Pyrinomonadaceae bacterium]